MDQKENEGMSCSWANHRVPLAKAKDQNKTFFSPRGIGFQGTIEKTGGVRGKKYLCVLGREGGNLASYALDS